MKLVGERRAIASAVMVFYALLYVMLALSYRMPEMNPAFFAIAGVYGLAFFALVAGYFWARWYAVGVSLYGVITTAVGIWQIGAEPILLFFGGTHLAATLMLWGSTMAVPYDGQTAWREKFHMDDNAVQRLGRSVIRAGVSLPFVLLYALAPKPPGAGSTIATIVAVLLTGLGVQALVRLKTWGVLALGAAGMLLTTVAGIDLLQGDGGVLLPAVTGALLIAAAVPFVAPMLKFSRR